MDHRHLQRIERLLAEELENGYRTLSLDKVDITRCWNKAEPGSQAGELYFKALNRHKQNYRDTLNKIKNLEETQRAIRRILRK
jgi:hypothetical protein